MQQLDTGSFSRNRYILGGMIILLMLLAPAFLSEFRMNLLGKFLALAILAIGIDLIWGYTGILSLGHGVFFGLGAYCMAMYLKLEASGGKLPDFMSWSGLEKLPWFWEPFSNPLFAIMAGMLIPVILAFILGYMTFRNRIKGVFFSILSQAMVIVFVTLFVGQQAYTGGTNGITNFDGVFGYSLTSSSVQIFLYYLTFAILIGVYFFSRRLIKSRTGRILVAIRDGENRVRFSGYNPTTYKVFIFTISAGLAGLAGMLFVMQVGIISPAMMGIVPSIEMVLWVAIGGRGTLIGAVIGAVLTNGAKSFFSEAFPDIWLYFLGALFVVSVLYLPEGIVGLAKSLMEKWRRKKVVKGLHENRSLHPKHYG